MYKTNLKTEEIIDKPWGYEVIWAKTSKYVGKALFIRAGESLSLQYHQQKEEPLFLESGENGRNQQRFSE